MFQRQLNGERKEEGKKLSEIGSSSSYVRDVGGSGKERLGGCERSDCFKLSRRV